MWSENSFLRYHLWCLFRLPLWKAAEDDNEEVKEEGEDEEEDEEEDATTAEDVDSAMDDLTFVTDVDAVAMCVPNESISPVFVIDGSVVVVGCVKPGFICVDSDRDWNWAEEDALWDDDPFFIDLLSLFVGSIKDKRL